MRRSDILKKLTSKTTLVDFGYKTKCWQWTGPTSGDNGRGCGYGRVSINGVTSAVHRVGYTHFHGYIPGKKQIDHKCNNRLCWNPTHIELVSHKENQKRRSSRGKKND